MPSPSVLCADSRSAQELSEETLQYYEDWKDTYLKTDPYVSGEVQYYVFYGDETYEEAHSTVEVTVSEAHGYGMLIAALMADYDSEAQDIFDGMYRYYLAHPSHIAPHLMAWQQSNNGHELFDSIGADSATDGRAVADWDDLCFSAPLMLSAKAAGDTAFHDTIRQEVIDIGVDSYFGNTIAMLCLITDDGGWLVPETGTLTGDVNADGVFDVKDIILMQKWLLAVPDTHLADGNAGDLKEDGSLDVFDLGLMKRIVLHTSEDA